MSFAIMVLLLIVAGIMKLADSAKWAAYDNREREKDRATYRQVNTYVPFDKTNVSRERDYVGEFEYANRLYQDLKKKFFAAHPIGSFYEYNDRNVGRKPMMIQSENDQHQAFQLDYRYSQYGENGPEWYCLWEARRDAVRRGKAPDNVATTIFQGYDAKHSPLLPHQDSRGRTVLDERYSSKFFLSASPPSEDYNGNLKSGTTSYGLEMFGIMIYGDPEDKYYQRKYEKVKAYLQTRQDYENRGLPS